MLIFQEKRNLFNASWTPSFKPSQIVCALSLTRVCCDFSSSFMPYHFACNILPASLCQDLGEMTAFRGMLTVVQMLLGSFFQKTA